MQIPLYQVDAFSSEVFAGNPAAVCPLDAWLPTDRLQAIAAENNVSETAFFAASGADFELRWFTPKVEVDLCGHATLASAFVVCSELEPGRTSVAFDSASGPLSVARDGDLYELDFPSRPATSCTVPAGLAAALGAAPIEVTTARDYLCVFESAAQVRALAPDFAQLAREVDRMVIATAPSDIEGVDFISRCFAPGSGVDEDPVTGSAHCTLTPYWARRLGKPELRARQVSARGGDLLCTNRGDRVGIAGRAALYLRGTIFI